MHCRLRAGAPDAQRTIAVTGRMNTTPPWLDERIAPNGRTVRENFADWCEASKVVDEHGLPLMVLHGTTANFHNFELQNDGQSRAFFFAGPTATRYVEFYVAQQGEGQRTIPVYLSLKNPKIVRASWDDDTFANPMEENEQIERAKAEGHDGVVFVEQDSGEVFYAAFHPGQIKSAIGNSGNYDPASACIADSEPAPEPQKRKGPSL